MIHQLHITIKQSELAHDTIFICHQDGLLTFSYDEPGHASVRLKCQLEPADIVSPTSFFYELGSLAARKKTVFPLVDVARFVQSPEKSVTVELDRIAVRNQFDTFFYPRDHKNNLSPLLQHLVPVFYQGYRNAVLDSLEGRKGNRSFFSG
ncbi:hypothetical protein [Alteromonas sp. 14N.309.X.WAT.G.H12]|uniref:hypothetical protein n=1 Tax=Alteromonas sp. 14N.309.X.WAT.G.H12 TaxID=3120824 RepID=UPI002FD0ECED